MIFRSCFVLKIGVEIFALKYALQSSGELCQLRFEISTVEIFNIISLVDFVGGMSKWRLSTEFD